MTTYACTGGCRHHVTRRVGPLSFCSTCFYVEETLRKEEADDLHALRERRELVLARVSDLLLRTGVDDAALLIRKLEKL